MNFTREIKRELLKKIPTRRCCKRAALGGFLFACGAKTEEGFYFTTEQEDVAAFALEALEECGLHPELTKAAFDPKQGRDKLSFSVKTGVLEENVPQKDCCALSFLSGAFLGGGCCTLPKTGKKTGYHLEVNFERERGAELFSAFCERFQLLPPGMIRMGEKVKVYFKSREAIADFLSVAGAESALKTLEEISSEREKSNLLNRKGNCFAGNADRAAIASAAQVLAIEKLKREGTLASLSPELYSVALCRLENPELSLSELAQKLLVTKSCLSHRLKKLMILSGTCK